MPERQPTAERQIRPLFEPNPEARPSLTLIGGRLPVLIVDQVFAHPEAIRSAVASLQPGDVLLIAGKGHETGQIVGDKVLPFSDHEAASAALAEHAA